LMSVETIPDQSKQNEDPSSRELASLLYRMYVTSRFN